MDLSVIVLMVGGPVFLERCLRHLTPQAAGSAVEVIVPYDDAAPETEPLRREFPQVKFLHLGGGKTHARPGSVSAAHELYDRRAAAALAAARGRIIGLLQDFGPPDPDWCRQVLEAHRFPHAAIGGAVEHSGRGVLNWAVYFQDFGGYQLPLREGPSEYLTDVNVTYKREALDSVRRLWSSRYNEATINWALARAGQTLWLHPGMVVRQNRERLSLPRLVVERASWGRLFGSARVRELSPAKRLLYILASPLIPAVLLARYTRRVLSRGRHGLIFLAAFPALSLLTLCWCAGEFWGYVTRRPVSVE
jgi:hypothetical protein